MFVKCAQDSILENSPKLRHVQTHKYIQLLHMYTYIAHIYCKYRHHSIFGISQNRQTERQSPDRKLFSNTHTHTRANPKACPVAAPPQLLS